MIKRRHSRVGILTLFFCFSSVCLLTDSSRALSQQQPEETLTADAMVTREIGGDEKHSYRLPLVAGQFVRIAVEQSGVDAVLLLSKPDGQVAVEVNNYPLHEPERLSLITETEGEYRLKVSVADPRSARADYTIRVENWRQATSRDSQFVDAERQFSGATRLWRQGKADLLPQAAAMYEATLPVWRQLSERHSEMTTLIYLGVVNERQQKIQRSIELYEQALPISRELGHRRFESASLNGIGWGWHILGEYRRALEYFQPALVLRQSLGIGRETVQTLTCIALNYTQMGEANLALEAYRQTLPLARTSGDKVQHAFALDSMALLQIRLNRYHQALDLLRESLALWRETSNRYGEAAALNLTGLAYSNLFDLQNALSYYTQAIDLAEKTGNRYGAAQTLNNLGVQYAQLGDPDQAQACYERALQYWRGIGNRVEELRALNNLSLIHYQKGNIDRALESLKAHLGDRLNGKYVSTDAAILSNMALFHLQRGRIKQAPEEYQLAVEWYEKALTLSRENRDRGLEVRALSGKAEAHLELNQLDLARKEIDLAVSIADRIRTEIGSAENRILFQPWLTMVYKNQVHALMALHQRDTTAGFETLALHASEQYRLRTLVELLSGSRIELSQGIDAGQLTALKQLQLKLESAEDRRSQLLNRQHTEKLAPLEREIQELLRKKDLLEAQIRTTHPQYAALKMPEPLTPREIQKQLLDNETILLEYLLGRDGAYLWLVTAGSISSYQLPQTKKIDQAARRVQGLLASQNQPPEGENLKEKHARQTRQKTEFDQAAGELSQMILGPVAGKLANKRLLIVGDGVLQYIPFGVLPEPQIEGRTVNKTSFSISNKPLIVNHEIVTLPSASVLATLRQIRAGRSAAPHALAVLADPVFNSEDERVRLNTLSRSNPQQSGKRPLDSTIVTFVRDVERSAADSGVQAFRRLHFSRQEAEAITGLLPASERLQALDFAADRRLALSGKLGEYRILHFATHGLLNNKTPALSGLVFSLVDEEGQPRNGFLRLHEIYNLKLNADLVVLSGCQTALGQEISGEGLIGLTRGFMYAGAPRVVASLWKVNDQATANLMKVFYKRMLNDRMSPAAALRAAQIAMWKAEPNAIPYRWGAFILQGDWR